MRLADIQFEFRPEGPDALKCCLPGRAQALARTVRDKTYPSMWRVVHADGRRSDMTNRARAKDIAWGLAESLVFVGEDRDVA
jgi:hypothetical protein